MVLEIGELKEKLSQANSLENNIPFFGICLGMQCAIIDYARNVWGLKDANSAEFDSKTANHVIDIMLSQKDVVQKGASMRLGEYSCEVNAKIKSL